MRSHLSAGDLTSTQVRSHIGGITFLHAGSFCQEVPPTQDFPHSLDMVCFYNNLTIDSNRHCTVNAVIL